MTSSSLELVKIATIKDIASRLGISDATVSRALTENAFVRPELKERIFRMAEELDYKPNMLAVGLRTSKTRIIALIVPDISNTIYIQLVKHIEEYCSNDGYSVILCNTNEDIEKEKKLLGIVRTGLIDGAILVPCIRKKPEDEYINNVRIKNLILFNRNLEGSTFDIVTSDHYKGIGLAMEHFYKLGYRRIGALVGEVRTSVGKERYWAYMDALRNLEFILDEELIKFGTLSYETGYVLTTELLAAAFSPEAILVFNNALCKGCIAAIKDSGKKIPGDIAVITVDEIENWDMMEPKLTFVKQSLAEMSRKSYEILQKRINDTSAPVENRQQNKVILPVQLIINESCGNNGNIQY